MWLHDTQGPGLDRLSGIYRPALNLLGQLSTRSQTRPLLSCDVSGLQSWSQLQASLSLWVSSHTLPLRSGSAVSLPHHILGTFLFFCTPFGGASLCSPSVSLHCLYPLNLSWLSLVYSTHPPTIRDSVPFDTPAPQLPWTPPSSSPGHLPGLCSHGHLLGSACLRPPASIQGLGARKVFKLFVTFPSVWIMLAN